MMESTVEQNEERSIITMISPSVCFQEPSLQAVSSDIKIKVKPMSVLTPDRRWALIRLQVLT